MSTGRPIRKRSDYNRCARMAQRKMANHRIIRIARISSISAKWMALMNLRLLIDVKATTTLAPSFSSPTTQNRWQHASCYGCLSQWNASVTMEEWARLHFFQRNIQNENIDQTNNSNWKQGFSGQTATYYSPDQLLHIINEMHKLKIPSQHTTTMHTNRYQLNGCSSSCNCNCTRIWCPVMNGFGEIIKNV